MTTSSTTKKRFDEDALIDYLFPPGQRYIFVFKQGFKRTNVQAVEFLYLLQMHTGIGEQENSKNLQIMSTKDIREVAQQYLPSLISAKTEDEHTAILNSLVDFFKNKAVVDFHMTTAILYLPESADANFRDIVVESGYIHSYGNYILTNDFDKISPKDLEKSLEYALDFAAAENKKSMIVPYCHEDFSSRDRAKSMFLGDGLDDVKFHMSKAYVGQERLYKFLSDFMDRHDDEACLAPTKYELAKTEFARKFPEFLPSTVWLITDFALRDDELSPQERKLFLVYRQILKNENYYHFYEENKPAWASHTTLPHTLAGAMINLSRRWLPSGDAQICDPFSGSGTVFLESQKFTGLRCKSYDLSPLNVRVLADNVRYFRSSSAELIEIDRLLAEYETSNAADPFAKKGSSGERLRNILDVVRDWRIILRSSEFLNLDDADVETGFSRIGSDLGSRIALYCALRAAIRGSVDLDRDISTWDEIFKREISQLRGQMANHIDELQQIGGSIQFDSVTVGAGSYSQQVLPPLPSGESADLFSMKEFSVCDVADLPEKAFNAIVCDPPYGFNTEEDRVEIIQFAELLVRKLVESLKPDGGQIIMALPRYSYTGREIPLALRSDQIARRLIDYCLKTGRDCWRPALVLPFPLTKFIQPPYYWRSEKALVRKILHFWISPTNRR